MIRIGHKVFGRMDYEGGAFTYGNRIAVAQYMTDESISEYARLKKCYREIFGYSCRWIYPLRRRARVLLRLTEGIKGWIEKEQQLLHYAPSEDEQKAGIREFAEKVGDLATIKAIAATYSRDPDEVLRWEYSKVFGILLVNLEEARYNERYQKVMDAKHRTKYAHKV